MQSTRKDTSGHPWASDSSYRRLGLEALQHVVMDREILYPRAVSVLTELKLCMSEQWLCHFSRLADSTLLIRFTNVVRITCFGCVAQNALEYVW